MVSAHINLLEVRRDEDCSELPATAWPCRVRHATGIKEPVLEVDPRIFQKALKELQRLQYGVKLKDYSPEAPEDDPFSGILDDDTSFLSTTDESSPATDTKSEKELHSLYNICSDLQPKSRENLLKFERKDFVLRDRVEGLKAVHELVRGRPLHMAVVSNASLARRTQRYCAVMSPLSNSFRHHGIPRLATSDHRVSISSRQRLRRHFRGQHPFNGFALRI